MISQDLTARIAHRFAGNLVNEIGMNDLRTVIERNASETNPNVCHSHDFCDANMTMLDAFTTVTGRDITADDDPDVGLWKAAWDHAIKIFPLYVASN